MKYILLFALGILTGLSFNHLPPLQPFRDLPKTPEDWVGPKATGGPGRKRIWTRLIGTLTEVSEMRGMTIGWLVGVVLFFAVILFLDTFGVWNAIGSPGSFFVGMLMGFSFSTGGLVIGGLLDDSY